MRSPDNDPELAELVRRYVTPERRYLRLGGGVLRLNPAERALFRQALADAAARITPGELAVLLDCGWRERKTAAWLIAVARRIQFREQIGALLLASEGPYAGMAYCVALTCFGTAADAELLVTYLDRYLLRPDLYYDQDVALGALLCLDATLDTDRAAQFIAPGGLWQQWIDGPPSKPYHRTPQDSQVFVGQLCAFAEETTNSGRFVDDQS